MKLLDQENELPNVSFEEYEQIKAFLSEASSEEPSSSPVSPDKEKPSTFENLFSSFMKVTNQWSRIIDAFKTVRSSEVKQTLLGKGFEYFSQSAQVQISKGIKEEFFDKYLDWVYKRIKVPEERKQDVQGGLEPARWGDSTMWLASNILFSVEKGGNVKFASILCARNDVKNTYDFVFQDIQSEFKLAPDVMVISNKLSVLGGIWDDTQEQRINVPKSLNTEDITTVMNFFQIVVFKSFADQF